MGECQALPSVRVVQVNTCDAGGGAETSALSLHKAVSEAGSTSVLVVGRRETSCPGVLDMRSSPHFEYGPGQSALWRRTVALKSHAHRWLGLEAYRDPWARDLVRISGIQPEVIHLHNLHGGYFDLGAIHSLGTRYPLVLDFHDFWMATGHCAIPGECRRFETGCGRCPDLARPEAARRDATRFNLWRKRRLLTAARPVGVVHSAYVRARLKRSWIASELKSVEVIPLGVDTEVFRPATTAERGEIRRRLDLPLAARVFVTHCRGGDSSPFRDFVLMRAVAERVASRLTGPLFWLILGGDAVRAETRGTLEVRHLPHRLQPIAVRDVLWAADAFLMAPRDETFGLAIAEAMACGLPVVVTEVGAVRELVERDVTGLLAEANSQSLSACLEAVLQSANVAQLVGRAAAEFVSRERGMKATATRYLELYEGILAERRATAT